MDSRYVAQDVGGTGCRVLELAEDIPLPENALIHNLGHTGSSGYRRTSSEAAHRLPMEEYVEPVSNERM